MPLTPKNRKEEWLEGLVEHETTLTPKNRCEAWMKEIIDASGGGGGGTGGGVLNVTATVNEAGTEMTLDKTWSEIATADFAIVTWEDGQNVYKMPVIQLISGGGYAVILAEITYSGSGSLEVLLLSTESENGYPSGNI